VSCEGSSGSDFLLKGLGINRRGKRVEGEKRIMEKETNADRPSAEKNRFKKYLKGKAHRVTEGVVQEARGLKVEQSASRPSRKADTGCGLKSG